MYYSPWPNVTDCNNAPRPLDFWAHNCHTTYMKNKNAQTRSKNHSGTIFFSICAAFFIGPWIVGSLIRMTTPQVTVPTTVENNIPAPAEVATPDDAESKAWEKHYNGLSEEEKVEAVKALIIEPTEPPNRFLPNGAR